MEFALLNCLQRKPPSERKEIPSVCSTVDLLERKWSNFHSPVLVYTGTGEYSCICLKLGANCFFDLVHLT